MSDQAFTHPQQVRDVLAATIGEDVFKQMEAQDPLHRVGNPLPQAPVDPAPAAAPAPAAPAPAPQPADPAPSVAPAAAPSDTVTSPPDGQPAGKKLVLGKYASEEEATEAYHRLLHANKELMRKLDASAAPATEQSPAPVRQEPNARAAQRDELTKLWQDKYGVEPADLEALKALAREAVTEEIGPERAKSAAEAAMLAKYPDIANFRDEIVQFVAADPATGAIVDRLWKAGDYEGAMEVSYLKFDNQRRLSAERAMLANDTVRKEEVEAARKDAGLIPSQVTGVHGAQQKQYAPSNEEQRTLENLYRAGHKEPWLRANIGATLPDDVFGVERQ